MNPPVLRLIDANANRAREALRVIEDYARFIRNDQPAAAALKQIRHDLRSALASVHDHALLCRDTPGDVGTANATPAEQSRADLPAVITAAGKRVGEALRAIEEYLKTIDPQAAGRVEALRYRFYDLETRIARALQPRDRFKDVRLYVLITESCCQGDWFATAAAAIDGGADAIQLREKEMDGSELLTRARRLAELCRKNGVLLIINDRPDIAILSGADGVHLGQGDLPAIEARKLLGSDKVIGVSTHNLDQARSAVADGADYIGIGPVFPSATKPRDILPGLAFAQQVAEQIAIPAVAIAGITADNVDEVRRAGICRIAVTAAVTGAADASAAAAALKARLVTPGKA